MECQLSLAIWFVLRLNAFKWGERMAKIYCMSDIHGCLSPLKESLSLIDLQSEDRVIFLGDYVDRGVASCQVLQTIMDFDKQYPGQVTVLLGNHDEWFCDWLFYPTQKYVGYGMNMVFSTIESFFDEREFQAILNRYNDAPNIHVPLFKNIQKNRKKR